MFQVCIMSGLEGNLGSENKVYLTVLGGCELTCPTVARQIVAALTRTENGRRDRPRQVFVTILGATEIKAPTLAQEYLDLRDLIQAGTLSVDDWDRTVSEVGRADVELQSYTVMGGFSDCELPSESEEIESLAMQRHLGNIAPEAGQILECAVGQRGAERRATLRRAATVGI